MNARSSATRVSEAGGSTDHDQPVTHEAGPPCASNPYVGTVVPLLHDELTFILHLRRSDDPQDIQVQLVSGTDHFMALTVPDEYELHSVDLLIPERDRLSQGGYCKLTALLGRFPDDRFAVRYLAITDTGRMYRVPPSTSKEVPKVGEWQLLYAQDAFLIEP